MPAKKAVAPPLSVLTVTRRAPSLARCLQSVACQSYPGAIEHVIVVDDLPEAARSLAKDPGTPASVRVVNIPRSPQDRDGPARLGALRNEAVSLAAHEFVAFLDDDNAWTTRHLSSLWQALAGGYYMVHSQRFLYESDGQPYLRPEFPWARDEITRNNIYRLYTRLGVVSPGRHIFRDRMGLPHSSVDLGEWLFRREFLRDHPFVRTYTADDWQRVVVEDRKLATDIASSGVTVTSTKQPTLHYYLGGFSNNFSGGASLYWRHPTETS